jgi:hypothetical protein
VLQRRAADIDRLYAESRRDAAAAH